MLKTDLHNISQVLLNHQPFPFDGLNGREPTLIISAAVGWTKTAKLFDVPIITIAVIEGHGGTRLKDLQNVFKDQRPMNRSSINISQGSKVIDLVKQRAREQLVQGGSLRKCAWRCQRFTPWPLDSMSSSLAWAVRRAKPMTLPSVAWCKPPMCRSPGRPSSASGIGIGPATRTRQKPPATCSNRASPARWRGHGSRICLFAVPVCAFDSWMQP
jgi:hypothetical protein